MEAPQNPAGAFAPEENYSPERREEFIAVIAGAPTALREVTCVLGEGPPRFRDFPLDIEHRLPNGVPLPAGARKQALHTADGATALELLLG